MTNLLKKIKFVNKKLHLIFNYIDLFFFLHIKDTAFRL